MSEDTMAEFEAQFAQPDIRAEAGGPMCTSCGKEPAFSGLCEDCKQHDGSCLRCPGCSEREGFRLAAGLLGVLHQSSISGVPMDAAWAPIVEGLSRHSLMGVIAVLTVMAYEPARMRAENGGVPVEDWLARIRATRG